MILLEFGTLTTTRKYLERIDQITWGVRARQARRLQTHNHKLKPSIGRWSISHLSEMEKKRTISQQLLSLFLFQRHCHKGTLKRNVFQ